MPLPSPTTQNLMLEFVIERVGERGDGLAQGKAFARTLPGEHVQQATSGARSITQPSPDRVPAFCPVFETCGGCKLQHWQAAPYQAWKTSLLVEALKARGLAPKIEKLVDAHGEGRRRASFHVREIEGQWQAGFMAAGTHSLVPIQRCPILVPKLQDAPVLAARFGPLFGECDVLITAAENGLDIAIKAKRQLPDKALQSLDALMQQQMIARIALNGQTLVQRGAPLIQTGKAQIALPIGAFLQATQRGEEVLSSLVESHMGKAKKVADLFCGLGPFTLRLAESRNVEAFDSDKPAIAAVGQALRHVQGLRPVKPQVLDLFNHPLTPADLNAYDAVVLDPPRAGAQVQCEAIAKSNLTRVVMVACDVQSFARDAAILVAAGFLLKTLTPVDQFKYSAHLECVGLFTRRQRPQASPWAAKA